jgi:hypothetical protein
MTARFVPPRAILQPDREIARIAGDGVRALFTSMRKWLPSGAARHIRDARVSMLAPWFFERALE